MQLDFRMTDDILIASVTGELDHHGAAKAREEIDKTIDVFCSKNLILNFERVSFMDSSGIGVVMGRYNKVKGKEGKLYIAGCSKYVKKILEMAGIFTIASMSETVEDAIYGIQGKIVEQMTMEVVVNG